MAEEMYGIVSVLDDEHQDAVCRLWEEIERDFSVSIRDTHVPHFSYHVARRYAETVRETLERIAQKTPPISAMRVASSVSTYPSGVKLATTLATCCGRA